MDCSDLIERFHGSVGSIPLEGIEPLDLMQSVIDELWSQEIPEHIIVPAPYVTTVAGVLAYSFDATNDDNLPPIIPGNNTIRRIRGLWKPALTTLNVNDYNYRGALAFDQNIIGGRLYEGGVSIDNELRKVAFHQDPGDSTATWKTDYYPLAPQLDESKRVPVIVGWEMKLVLVGMKATFEEWRTGQSEYWRPLFDARRVEYRAYVRQEKNIPQLDENLYLHQEPRVEAQ